MRALRVVLIAMSCWFAFACGSEAAQAPSAAENLPPANVSGYVPVNGVRLWYASYGSGPPVLMLHGGITSSVAWLNQIPALRGRYRVIVVDSRGHGRSTRTAAPFSYHLMATDTLALLDYLHLGKVSVVGWSDGANIGLDLAIHHPERVAKLFAFAGNTDPAGLKEHVTMTPAMRVFFARAASRYHEVSQTPNDFMKLVQSDERMAGSGPYFTLAQLRSLRVPTWIVDGDRDQFIKRENIDYQAREIPSASELILPGVTHGAPDEDPALFNAALLDFLGK